MIKDKYNKFLTWRKLSDSINLFNEYEKTVSPVSGIIKSIDNFGSFQKIGIYIRGPFDEKEDDHTIYYPCFERKYETKLFEGKFDGKNFYSKLKKKGYLEFIFQKLRFRVWVGAGYVTDQIKIINKENVLGEIVLDPKNSFAELFISSPNNLEIGQEIIGGKTRLDTITNPIIVVTVPHELEKTARRCAKEFKKLAHTKLAHTKVKLFIGKIKRTPSTDLNRIVTRGNKFRTDLTKYLTVNKDRILFLLDFHNFWFESKKKWDMYTLDEKPFGGSKELIHFLNDSQKYKFLLGKVGKNDIIVEAKSFGINAFLLEFHPKFLYYEEECNSLQKKIVEFVQIFI